MSTNLAAFSRIWEPRYDILETPDVYNRQAVLKHIECVGRVCYKSEGKITDDSYHQFIERRKREGHWAILEHYVFVLKVPYATHQTIINQIRSYSKYNPMISEAFHYIHITGTNDGNDDYKIISFSATGFNNLMREIHVAFQRHDQLCDPDASLLNVARNMSQKAASLFIPDPSAGGVFRLLVYMIQTYPELIYNPFFEDCQVLHSEMGIQFLSMKEIEMLPPIIREIHMWLTVKFRCDRGIGNEIVRHRPASYAQESTRYCNYGNLGYGFVEPYWMNDLSSESAKIYNDAIDAAFHAYDSLIKMGLNPQDARGVLPLATKTELFVTANLAEWKHIFSLRDDKSAHPDMIKLMHPLHNEMILRQPEIFATTKGDQNNVN